VRKVRTHNLWITLTTNYLAIARPVDRPIQKTLQITATAKHSKIDIFEE